MIRRFALTMIAGVLFTALAFAADVSGTWTGTLTFGDNQFPLTYTLKQDGSKLTGTVSGPGGDLPLADGKIEGDKLSFSLTVDMGGTPARFVSEGVLKGEEIAITTKGPNMPDNSYTLKRAK